MTHTHSDHDYEQVIGEKLNDAQLRTNLRSAMDTLIHKRKDLLEDRYPEWEQLRTMGQNAKLKVLAQLDTYVQRFEENATKNGFVVHYASTAKDANEIIYNLAKERGVERILKGKSMASEEIELNRYMKEKGIVAKETDLGELIIQLIDEHPVHIVVPAIHK
ncbi:LUD domain-containing protein, partial [Helicobacter heilmannii]